MRKILMSLAILTLVYSGAVAGIFKEDVNLADLAQLSPEALETLKNTEFNVFLRKVKHAVSVAEYEQDFARVSKLIEQSVPSAIKYSLPDFKKRLEKNQKEYEKAVSTEAKETAEAKKRKAAYEKSSM